MMPAATPLVSDTERRQNSMPVQEMTCRRNEVASTGTPSIGFPAVSSRTASGMSSSITFWRLVSRMRPRPRRSAKSASARRFSPVRRPRRVAPPSA